MMDSFSAYLGRVKAGEELKEQTKDHVRAALSSTEDKGRRMQCGGKRAVFPKLRTTAFAAAACLVLTAGGYAVYRAPVAYISIDINPSVELGINLFDRVVRAEAYNDDGALLLGEVAYSNLRVEDAVSALVLEAGEQGYLAEDGSSVIAITAQTDDADEGAQVLAAGESGAMLAMNESGQSAVLYADAVGLALRERAKEAGLSPGKYRLVQILQELDPDSSGAAYRDATITEVIEKADALLSDAARGGDESEEAAAAREEIRKAAAQVRAAAGQDAEENNANGAPKQEQESGPEEQDQGADRNAATGAQQEQNPPSEKTGQAQQPNLSRNEGVPAQAQPDNPNQEQPSEQAPGAAGASGGTGGQTGPAKDTEPPGGSGHAADAKNGSGR